MKKIGKILLFLIIVVGVVGGGGYFGLSYIRDKNREAERLEHIKDDMYLEVVYEDLSECKTKYKLNKEEESTTQCAKTELKVREAPTAASSIIGTAEKGEIYKIVEVEQTDAQFIWFRIVYQKSWKDPYKEAYISQPRSTNVTYVKAYNVSFDYSNPVINMTSDEFNVDSIDDIGKDGKYDQITVWDDQDGYKITHEVYIEREPVDRPGPQYWVKYTVTDKVGKTASIIQRVIFKYPPADSKCKDFSKIRG